MTDKIMKPCCNCFGVTEEGCVVHGKRIEGGCSDFTDENCPKSLEISEECICGDSLKKPVCPECKDTGQLIENIGIPPLYMFSDQTKKTCDCKKKEGQK